jgi:hypothetical protein
MRGREIVEASNLSGSSREQGTKKCTWAIPNYEVPVPFQNLLLRVLLAPFHPEQPKKAGTQQNESSLLFLD